MSIARVTIEIQMNSFRYSRMSKTKYVKVIPDEVNVFRAQNI